MFSFNYNKVLVILFSGLLSIKSIICWEYAVATNHEIRFYNENFTKINEAAHQFNSISAIAYDETNELIYFNDQSHKNTTIFSLSLTNKITHDITNIVQKIQNESIEGIAYDILDKALYWTDTLNQKIYKHIIKDNITTILFDGFTSNSKPEGIAIDFCRRYLYWTNTNTKSPSIERISLENGNKISEQIITKGLYRPTGIAVDQNSERIYWVDNKFGDPYTVESAKLDGTDGKIIIKGTDHAPNKIIVNDDSIYWTDSAYKTIWKMSKNNTVSRYPISKDRLDVIPYGIIHKTKYLGELELNNDCKDVIKKIRENINPIAIKSISMNIETPKICINGTLNENNNQCICFNKYTGDFCETNMCDNYCLNGQCYANNSSPRCVCDDGYSGERCDIYKCTGYCLHNGICSLDKDNQPICSCKNIFTGKQCEHVKHEVCKEFCDTNLYEDYDLNTACNCNNTAKIVCLNNGKINLKKSKCDCPINYSGDYCEKKLCNLDCHNNGTCIKNLGSLPKCECTSIFTGEHCEYLINRNMHCINYCKFNITEPEHKYLDMSSICDKCNDLIFNTTESQSSSCNGMTTSALIIASSVTLSFIILLLILLVIRRMVKPLRPKVRKTYVVRKNVTPLTCRPTEQQCEITIEDCCNMNICDTPCFDTKNLEKEANFKDDKKKLLNNIEHNGGDLY